MPNLLVEVGCEELPAHSVLSAGQQFADRVSDAILEAQLATDESTVRWAATPRRLIVGYSGVRNSQEDRVEKRRGPAVKAAYLPDGTASPALNGFCRGLGLTPDQVVVEGEYVWAEVLLSGRAAVDVLSELLPKAIQGVSFDKTMRWGSGRMRFARPIRWILAALDEQTIPFTLEEISSSNESRGHRFLNPAPFVATQFDALIDELQRRNVLADSGARVRAVVDEVSKLGSEPTADDTLVLENAQLVEWPAALMGEFREEFLSLPDSVLIETMQKHLRFFPVYEGGRISNRFVSITNGKTDDCVRRGNEWVLNARFNDAKFFFEEDKKRTLDEFLQLTERIMFQDKLGTIRSRADRLESLVERMAKELGLSESRVAEAKTAAKYCKADLSTGLVSEMASLQGKVGGEYARRELLPENVWRAIYLHYQAPPKPETEAERISVLLQCADASDRLAGFLHIGQKPTGSSDPYALRRAMGQLVEAQLASTGCSASIWEWIRWAADVYRAQGFDFKEDAGIETDVRELMWARYEVALSDIALDARQAAWESAWDENSARFAKRARVIESVSEDIDFVRAAKRPGNIVAAAEKKGFPPSDLKPELFETEAEFALFQAGEAASEELMLAASEQRFEDLAQRLKSLAGPVDAFFSSVMVMVEDAALRNNRLALLRKIAALYRLLGDFDKIVIEGEK